MKAIGNLIFFTIFYAIAIIMIMPIVGIPVLILHLFLIFGGAGKRIEKVQQKLHDSLMDGESIVVHGNEMRPYALFSRRSLIAISNSRVIYFKRPILGGFSMIDIQWKDVTDAELSQNILPNICGSKISFTHSIEKNNIIINISSEPATQIYKYAQKEEQAWEEKHRIRAIEETRAAAGGTYINPPSSTAPANQPEGKSVLDEINEAKEMLDQGIISDAEFNELKSKILNQGRSM
jgi:hypothetical protein